MTKHEAVNQLWLVCFFKLLQLSYTWDWSSQQLLYTTEHRTVLTILHLILQTIIAAQTMSTGGERERRPTLKCITVWWIKTLNQPTCTGEKHARQTPTLTFTWTEPGSLVHTTWKTNVTEQNSALPTAISMNPSIWPRGTLSPDTQVTPKKKLADRNTLTTRKWQNSVDGCDISPTLYTTEQTGP